MLDIPGWPELDKHRLVGGCTRLALQVDAVQLREEVARLPAALWGTTSGRVGVHRAAEAVFLRGYAPAQGELPIEDREPLEHLPYTRMIIEQLIPAQAMRCLLARLPPGVSVPPHIDRPPYFAKTLRLHVAVETHEQAWMLCAGLSYVMKPGEVWVLNNKAEHAVWNAHATLPRTHLICDFLPQAALLALLAAGERDLGVRAPPVERHFAELSGRGATSAH
jgi:hypothetical protein